MDAIELLKEARIVPVVVIDDPDSAVALAEALVGAGLRFVEITLRTPKALPVIERIAAEVPDAIVGAGSVRTPLQFAAIRNAGARFAVSPGFSEQLNDAARQHAMPFVPGAATASEVLALQEHGYTLMKFFPAELAGGIDMLKALGAPLPEARFFPTGGITPARAPAYLRLANVCCIGGSWITPPELLAAGDFHAIGAIARDAVTLAKRVNQA